MATNAVLTIRVDESLKNEFMALAKSSDRTAAQLVRDYMREMVQAKAADKQTYDDWFMQEVDLGIADLEAGRVVPHDEVEAMFAKRRAASLKRSEGKK